MRGALRALWLPLFTVALGPLYLGARLVGGGRDRRVVAWWSRLGLSNAGLRLRRIGSPIDGGGALLVNHCSWVDILAIGAAAPVHFVAKAEVAAWPAFGLLSRLTNTVFIDRRPAATRAQQSMLAARAAAGHLLCLFPEGTSSDGLRVWPFKSALLGAFFADKTGGRARSLVQPVSVAYRPRLALPPTFYGWWGAMPLFRHLWAVACLGAHGEVVLTFHDPLDPDDFADRKALAAAAERAVGEGRQAALASFCAGGP